MESGIFQCELETHCVDTRLSWKAVPAVVVATADGTIVVPFFPPLLFPHAL